MQLASVKIDVVLFGALSALVCKGPPLHVLWMVFGAHLSSSLRMSSSHIRGYLYDVFSVFC